LPNDNGLHIPKYDLLKNSSVSGSISFQKISGSTNLDHSIISLHTLVPKNSLFPGLVVNSGSLFDELVGSRPESLGVPKGSMLTIAQRTRDVSSNEIVIFDISNLYYGNKIHPGSLELFDENLSGSGGDISIRLKDNEHGGIYRADALTKHAKWNNVGNVFYDEGIVVIKSPHLPNFCKEKTNIKFKGEHRLHTMTVNIPCAEWNFVSSSNETYEAISPTTGANDQDLKSIYITGVNIHDDNFNIIMKANFSQPIVKTEEDEFVIRLKQDF
jgi:hypothetical protein